ncbi:mitoguardin-like [Ctenocephalides felis]|uniref:mitoguardin-like n=1 Tax=Ctenocephalides felis TaxID=7515 RepID=UPI000E6E2CC4|nr:mitoguardin-like [Ctenocephalides felis]
MLHKGYFLFPQNYKKKSILRSTITLSDIDNNLLSINDLSTKGFSALNQSIKLWEQTLKLKSVEDDKFHDNIKLLLVNAYKLREQYEALFLNDYQSMRSVYGSIITSTDDSFVSAEDEVADLDEFNDVFESETLQFYRQNQELLLEKGIPYRSLRTEFVRCSSDNEYLVKLHCIRLAFQYILKDATKRLWVIETMQEILANLLVFGGKDPERFLASYEDMIKFVEDTSNHELIEEELAVRNVKMITFYDVALDYILLDAFEDLEKPPSSVVSVVQNRWLSNGIKESALTTAVWSVIKAKRCMLKYSDGFRSRFYNLSEQIIPFMAWGFLGPDEKLKTMCQYFKDEMYTFFIDIYDFNKCRYTTMEDLSQDVFRMFETRANNISKMLKV